jgi:hypothetical protein
MLVSTRDSLSGFIELFTYDPDVHEVQIPRTVVVLHLPPLHPMSIISAIRVRAAPYCGSSPVNRSLWSDPESRIFAFTVQGYAAGSDDDHLDAESIVLYRCFVHSRTFRKHLSVPPKSGVDGLERVTIPWVDWGPQETRVLRAYGDYCFNRCVLNDSTCLRANTDMSRFVSGERVVLSDPESHADGHMFIRNDNFVGILDFNVLHGLSSPGCQVPGRSLQVQDVLEPTVISDDSVFENDITTALPYRLVLKGIDLDDVLDWMLYDEGLVAVKAVCPC